MVLAYFVGRIHQTYISRNIINIFDTPENKFDNHNDKGGKTKWKNKHQI